MYGWNGKANGRMDGCMDAWNGWMEWEGERMNRRMYVWMECEGEPLMGRMNGRDVWLYVMEIR